MDAYGKVVQNNGQCYSLQGLGRMIVLIAIVVLLATYYLHVRLSMRRKERMTAELPMLPYYPVIGHGHMFIGSNEKILENIEKVTDFALKRDSIVKIWLGSRLYIGIATPEDAQMVLDNCLQKDMVYRFLRPWLGNGLFVTPDVDLWKSHRKVLLPAFHNRVIEEYVCVFNEQSGVLIERLAELCTQKSFDVLPYITSCTLDIVFETAMGERMDVQNNPESDYLRARHSVINILNMRLFKIWLQPDLLFNMTSYAKEQETNIKKTHAFTDNVVQRRRDEFETGQDTNGNTQGACRFRVLLDMLFGKEIRFTNEQLREHIDSITIAGNDTTALVIAYTLVLLGEHQTEQELVYREQKDIFGDSKRGVTKEDLNKMCYLERVIKESMRLYTVVPIIARTAETDVQLPNGGIIPSGCGIVVGAWAMHRSEAVWGSDARKFRPDRFLPEESAKRHPASFIPFSFGPRNCIGRNFGMLIMKTILSHIIRSYHITSNGAGKLKIELLLFPIKGHQIAIKPRVECIVKQKSFGVN